MKPATTVPLFWPLWIAAVVFIYHVPHTIALRNLLLVLGLVALAWRFRVQPRPVLPASLRPALWALGALTLWMAVQALAVSPAPTYALDRIRADWLMHLLWGLLAACIGARVANGAGHRAAMVALLVAVVLVPGYQAWLWQQSGAWPLGATPYAARDFQSLLHGFLAAMLIGDRMATMVRHASPLSLPPPAGWGMLATVLAIDPLLYTRNGSVVVIVMVLVGGAIVLALAHNHARRRPLRGPIVLAIVTAAALAWATTSVDARWSGFFESYRIGWTSPSDYWRTANPEQRPATPLGRPLEESAYARAAWARQAVGLIAGHPLGLGYAHDAFGRGVALKYGHAGMGSSHSGWLDFAIGTGIPGLALLLLTASLAIRGGWRQFQEHGDGVGLMFSFLVGGYLLRCLLDGHLSGWRLGLFAFLCGVLIAAMKGGRRLP